MTLFIICRDDPESIEPEVDQPRPFFFLLSAKHDLEIEFVESGFDIRVDTDNFVVVVVVLLSVTI